RATRALKTPGTATGRTAHACRRRRPGEAAVSMVFFSILAGLAATHDPHPESQCLTDCDHFTKDVAVGDRNMIAQVMRHYRLHRATKVRGHERPLARGALPPGIPHLRRQLDHLALTYIHPEDVVLDVRPRPGHLARQALTGKRSSCNGKISS